MSLYISIFIILISIIIIVTINRKINKGDINPIDSYSFKAVIYLFILNTVIIAIISSIIFHFSDSFELSISIGIILLFLSIASISQIFLLEYQIKRRGGKRKEKIKIRDVFK